MRAGVYSMVEPGLTGELSAKCSSSLGSAMPKVSSPPQATTTETVTKIGSKPNRSTIQPTAGEAMNGAVIARFRVAM